MSEYLNPPKSSFQHPTLKIKKGNASTWREQNGYPIAKVKNIWKVTMISPTFFG